MSIETKDTEADSEYVIASEAARILGVSPHVFRRIAEHNAIQTRTIKPLPTRYRRACVERLLRESSGVTVQPSG